MHRPSFQRPPVQIDFCLFAVVSCGLLVGVRIELQHDEVSCLPCFDPLWEAHNHFSCRKGFERGDKPMEVRNLVLAWSMTGELGCVYVRAQEMNWIMRSAYSSELDEFNSNSHVMV